MIQSFKSFVQLCSKELPTPEPIYEFGACIVYGGHPWPSLGMYGQELDNFLFSDHFS